MPIFCQKTSTLSKIQVLSCYFIQILHSKPPVRMPILVQKLQFCQNYPILWLRKKIDFRRSLGGGLENLWQLLGLKSQFIIAMDVFFFHKIWASEHSFIKNIRFLDKMWTWEQYFFCENSEKSASNKFKEI